MGEIMKNYIARVTTMSDGTRTNAELSLVTTGTQIDPVATGTGSAGRRR